MSYARWGTDSAVYVYADAHGGVACCGCALDTEPVAHTYTDFFGVTHKAGEPKLFGRTEHFFSADELISHMREHITAGHAVPEELLDPATYHEPNFDPFERNPSNG